MGARASSIRAVVVGASSGGIDALRQLMSGLAADFTTPLIIVQHTAAEGSQGLVEVLDGFGPLKIGEAQARHPVLPGHAYLAPPGYHLLVEKNERFSLSVDERVCYVRPSVDVLFESAADVWRASLVGVILTGANDDGANGLKAVRAAGGKAIVQLPSDAFAAEMPMAALARAGADYVAPSAQVGALLSRLCAHGATSSSQIKI